MGTAFPSLSIGLSVQITEVSALLLFVFLLSLNVRACILHGYRMTNRRQDSMVLLHYAAGVHGFLYRCFRNILLVDFVVKSAWIWIIFVS